MGEPATVTDNPPATPDARRLVSERLEAVAADIETTGERLEALLLERTGLIRSALMVGCDVDTLPAVAQLRSGETRPVQRPWRRRPEPARCGCSEWGSCR